ncbi:DUF389 domain-containing protein [Nocardioides bruguierae]|uniref:DUF389 domain-containing protein n=1 Tax=Nocardioides bruguierae TaxID=2945102 RepID=A0A9X2D7F4_9ACTN|nr:DUF389 domain-containing protein [Nocardioides bruguierae]MCM0620207.1 DUF389 domain-containing protein [Nocardioides bruguierae]
MSLRGLVLPPQQRRTLEEMTTELDLRVGDRRSRLTAYWTMLTLSGTIAAAGVLSDSTATVIGAMIIAPLSTPIMGTALALTKRQRGGTAVFVLGGVVVVVLIGWLAALTVPDGYDLLANAQVAGRTSPSLLDMVAAIATGLAGAVALARKDLAAVLPGVAIAISLVPPLAVVGICLGLGRSDLAWGAGLLFVSNVLALVLAGTLVFAVLGYAVPAPGHGRTRARTYVLLTTLVLLVSLPLALNTTVAWFVDTWTRDVERAATAWVADVDGATVTGVELHGFTAVVSVTAPGDLPPHQDLLDLLDVPESMGIRLEVVTGHEVEVREVLSSFE